MVTLSTDFSPFSSFTMASASDGVVPRKHRLFVAAIDFGTTYSGYAFSSKDGWEKEPLKINSNVWNAGTKRLLSSKAPTTLLLNPDKSFLSFGYDAETEYSDMAENGKNVQSYYYFDCFKMLLHDNKVNKKVVKMGVKNRFYS